MPKMAIALALVMAAAVPTAGDRGPTRVMVLDDCDPNDPGWTPTGGCTLDDGDVTVAEFNALLPHGHPAWRFETAYAKIEVGDKLKVRNEGGRRHTFTEVAAFGGGFVPPLNNPAFSPPVPECAGGFANPAVAASNLPPGAALTLQGQGVGTHLFQCCIHPWMRAAVKVSVDDEDDED